MLGTDKANFGCVISKGRCYDPGNFSRTRLSGKRLLGLTSGLMPVLNLSCSNRTYLIQRNVPAAGLKTGGTLGIV